MTTPTRRRFERPVLMWTVPWRHTWMWWKHEFQGGWLIPSLIFLPWILVARTIVRPIQYPFGIPQFFGVPLLVVAFIYWQYPDADLGVEFWLRQVLTVGRGLLLLTGGGFVLVASLCALSLLPGNVSIYQDRAEFTLSGGALTGPQRIVFEDLVSVRIIIVDVPEGVGQTLWFISTDIARSVPLDLAIDHDQLRQSLPCPVTVDNRRNSRIASERPNLA